MVCARTHPSVDDKQRPKVPTAGMSVCRQVQIYNERTRRYESFELCGDELSTDVRAER
jgi:hypothetical protein